MTKNKSKPYSILGLMILLGTVSFAQSINFIYTDSTNASYNLEDVRKITFDANLMYLHLWDGSIYSKNVSTIGYYQYDESSLNGNEWTNNENEWEVVVFPNPTSNTLNIHFKLPKEAVITIALFDLQGKLILRKSLGKQISGEHQATLDLAGIPHGTYTCRILGQLNSITKQVIKQ